MATVRDLWVSKRTGLPTPKHGQGKRYQAVWHVDGEERTKAFVRKLDADRYAAKMRDEVESGLYVDRARGRETFRDYTDRWLATRLDIRPGTRDRRASHLRKHIYPTFGDQAIGGIRRTGVQAFVRQLVNEGLAPGTVRSVYTTLQVVLRAAVEDRVIPRSPADGVKLPQNTRSLAQPLNAAQLALLTDAVAELAPRLAVLPILGAATGLRPGELLGLEVDPERGLDFLRRQIRVTQQLVTPSKGRPYIGPPKTPASVRTVPVDDVTLARVTEHLAQWPVAEVEVEDRTGSKTVTRTARLLVVKDSGRPWRRAEVGVVWREAYTRASKAAVKAGGEPLPGRPGPHGLRHTYVSLLIQAGMHAKVIQTLVGHRSITETLDTYGHLFSDQDEDTRSAIGAALRHGSTQTDRPPTVSGLHPV